MPEGGIIEVRAERLENVTFPNTSVADPRVRISIRDYGEGIPADVLPRIFDPYFTTKQGGTGLGLATAYAIVEVTTEQVINAQPTAQFIKGQLTIGTASSQVSVIPLGEMCRYEPASNLNDATVATPVVL